MAGTNKTNKLIRNGPCIILKDPQLPENIGMCARSMLNYGFSDLRIVNPKKALPNDRAMSASAGAFEKIAKNTKIFSNLEEAMKSVQILFATSVRVRDLEKNIIKASKSFDLVKCPAGCRYHAANYLVNQVIEPTKIKKTKHINML